MTDEFDTDWLEKALKKEDPYIENNGFSKKVVESLPAKKLLSWSMKRRIVKGVVAACGLAIALGTVASAGAFPEVKQLLDSSFGITISFTALFVAIAGGCVWVSMDRA